MSNFPDYPDQDLPSLPSEVQAGFKTLTIIRRRSLPSEPPQRILVRATNWVGDAVLILPTLSELRRWFPPVHMAVLAVPRVAPLFQGHPAVSEIILYPGQSLISGNSGGWRFLKELRQRRFDLALLFPNSWESALVAWAAGIPHRIGYNTEGRSLLLTTVVRGPEKLGHLHHVYRHLGVLRGLGEPVAAGLPTLYLRDAEVAQARNILIQNGIEPGQLVIGISPGATYGTAKQWYPERFAAVAEQLQEEFAASVVLLGGPGDRDAAARIVSRMRRPPVNLVGHTDLRLALALIKPLALLITNDSGLMHVAAALRVPLVALFGSTDPRTTGPFTPLASLLRHPVDCSPCLKRECPIDHRCMDLITTAEVVSEARRWLTRTA